ncbi:hypothetical protein EJ04DRAFT_163475 [Polyplosphaeria fusca]|uniref:Uncharacterized protein n=1 Tax=Polyplosphaeria fusca TaxID=682080 RepID=A0A9P4R7Z2_9PLEO|nr:hypothetical protein EJ04DRAFT_163475 [Polyplosphaeria fusca]
MVACYADICGEKRAGEGFVDVHVRLRCCAVIEQRVDEASSHSPQSATLRRPSRHPTLPSRILTQSPVETPTCFRSSPGATAELKPFRFRM